MTAPPSSASGPPASVDLMPSLDISEKGARGQRSDRRLFMQLQAFTGVADVRGVVEAIERSGVGAAVYADAQDPFGIAVLTWSEDAAYFTGRWRQLLQSEAFAKLKRKREYALFGRSYSLGYEPDLEEALVRKHIERATNPELKWVIWYPLRRSGAFARLGDDEQKAILREHGQIGFAFGKADLGHDIRLACFGLDANDNDFVIGLLGKELAPLSILVQTMRKTAQTSMYIEKLGPFFVGEVVWQSGRGGVSSF